MLTGAMLWGIEWMVYYHTCKFVVSTRTCIQIIYPIWGSFIKIHCIAKCCIHYRLYRPIGDTLRWKSVLSFNILNETLVSPTLWSMSHMIRKNSHHRQIYTLELTYILCVCRFLQSVQHILICCIYIKTIKINSWDSSKSLPARRWTSLFGYASYIQSPQWFISVPICVQANFVVKILIHFSFWATLYRIQTRPGWH